MSDESPSPAGTATTATAPDTPQHGVVGGLSRLDRFLPVWIGLAMVAGLLLGRWVPGMAEALDAVTIGSVSLPIAVGLLVMMYPVLAKVRYDEVGDVARDRRTLVLSLVLNWLVGPALMFTLAWTFLPDLPEYRTGLIIVGLARCIAMVIIWNDLACGDREAAAVLVALNSVFQVVAFGFLGWFYLDVLPGWLGLSTTGLEVSAWEIAGSVVIFLGIPLAAGYLTRRFGERAKGRAWYEGTFLPRIGPWALYGLLFTIVVLFALQGETITSQPWDVARIAVPLVVYFAVMWVRRAAAGPGRGTRVRTVHDPRLHRGRQQLRARHRGCHRRLRRDQRPGARRCRRAADRGPGARRPGLRQPLGTPLLPHPDCSAGGDPMSAPVVLFACIHNSGRSVAARVLTEHYAQGTVEARSAGSEPKGSVNPVVAEVLAERGLSTDRETATLLEPDVVSEADVVITMGCGETCPIFPGKRYEDWTVDDPAGQDLETVRRIVDDIDTRVRDLLASLA